MKYLIAVIATLLLIIVQTHTQARADAARAPFTTEADLRGYIARQQTALDAAHAEGQRLTGIVGELCEALITAGRLEAEHKTACRVVAR